MKYIAFLFLIFVFGCGPQKIEFEEVADLQNPLLEIKLLDTFHNQLRLDTLSSLESADFHPIYIGIKKDSIALNYSLSGPNYRTMDWEAYRTPLTSDLEIYVDTSRVIGSAIGHFIIPPPPPPLPNAKPWKSPIYAPSRGELKSYPVIIENNASDTLNIGYGDYIALLTQALDSTGQWRPIQKHYIYMCGTGLTQYYLPPQEILLTSCKRYAGNYQTKFRLAFGFESTSYSNEFSGQMNYSQFEESENEFY